MVSHGQPMACGNECMVVGGYARCSKMCT
jgi:hypothetical protein